MLEPLINTTTEAINATVFTIGYARKRGLSGLASDGLSKVSEKATKPFKDMRNVAIGGLDGFKDGLTDGTATAIEKNSRAKASTAQDNGRYDTSMPTRLSNRQDGAKIESADRVISSSERMRALENGGNMSAVQQKVQPRKQLRFPIRLKVMGLVPLARHSIILMEPTLRIIPTS